MLLLIDNYDSFTYNLVQRIGELDGTLDLQVFRNDKITADQAVELDPDHVIISPGPCTPREAGVSCEIISAFSGTVPLLGVCLGHQSIGHQYGMKVGHNDRIMHGKTSSIYHDGRGLFSGLPNPFEAIRYHSLLIYREDLPDTLEVTAWTDKGVIMGVRHKDYALEGVQFHPESILTRVGKDILQNFLLMSPQ